MIPTFLRRRLKTLVDRITRDFVDRLTHEIRLVDENNKAMDHLGRLLAPGEPWTGWTMEPAAVLTVVSDIQINRRSTVIECGSGLSTLYAAKALSLTGGKLISLEHDPAWAKRMRERLSDLSLSDHATVLDAELSGWTLNNVEYVWYDEKVVTAALTEVPPIDLVVIDGPPEETGPHCRYPAVPMLKPYLNDRYAIILDDTDRQMEREIVERWKSELTATFKDNYRDRNIAYIRKGSFYEV